MKANVSVKLAMSFTSTMRMRKAFLDRAASTTVASRESRVMRAPEQANDTGFQTGWYLELGEALPRDPRVALCADAPAGQWTPDPTRWRAGPRVHLASRSRSGLHGRPERSAPRRGRPAAM